MSLRDELQTRFDLDELNNLQQKYGVQQTSALKSQITASSPQSSYVQPISSQQPNSQPSTWDNPLIRNAFSTASGEATGYVIDGIKNQYHNYNK